MIQSTFYYFIITVGPFFSLIAWFIWHISIITNLCYAYNKKVNLEKPKHYKNTYQNVTHNQDLPKLHFNNDQLKKIKNLPTSEMFISRASNYI